MQATTEYVVTAPHGSSRPRGIAGFLGRNRISDGGVSGLMKGERGDKGENRLWPSLSSISHRNSQSTKDNNGSCIFTSVFCENVDLIGRADPFSCCS
ncbi:hypothetical protein EVAR_39338_1 [Eumeta japonica]|uniref:Uncharacterized protein n=1 Tax=Eumeta variegata TaxID=151549 RepID=A0A4C1WPL6_EUMVA|nr:hypothetical protein EVAR_39338_1 [Eumeta japonica]